MRTPARAPAGRDPARMPLIIGVTGHRDLREADRQALASRIQATLEGFATRYPATPLLLLSALAEGADRLVARVALELGAQLVVPLPLPRLLYADDFTSPASRAEFDELAGRALHVLELPLAPGNTDVAAREPGEARDRQYALAGAYIAQHSHVLLALWDGLPSPLVGGTAQIVRFKLDGPPEPYTVPHSVLDPPGTGPVYHVITPRRQNPTPDGPALAVRPLFPAGETDKGAERLHSIWARIDAFNREASMLPPLDPGRAEPPLVASVPVGALPADLESLRARYAVADTLAVHHQRRAFRVLHALLGLVLAAALLFDAYSHFGESGHRGWRATLVLYGLSILAVNGLWYRAHRRDYQNRYQDYRALAEGLRVQFFWTLVGIRLSAASHYLRRQRGELEWIRQALRGASLPLGPRLGGFGETERLALALRYWVGDQSSYFADRARRDQARRRRLERAARLASHGGTMLTVLLVLPALLAFAAGVFAPLGSLAVATTARLATDRPGRATLLFLTVLCAVIGALFQHYVQRRALPEHVKHYSRMSLLFAAAAGRLATLLPAGRGDEVRAVLRELGVEALAENGDWVLLHRERPLDVPDAEGVRAATLLKRLT